MENTPFGVGVRRPYLLNSEILEYLKWLDKKDVLGQDSLLIGLPTSLQRNIALLYCEKRGRQVEFVSLTRDTTESDLKQRKEIISNSTSTYIDQALIRAALLGRVFRKSFLFCFSNSLY